MPLLYTYYQMSQLQSIYSESVYSESVYRSSVLADTSRWLITPVAVGQTSSAAHANQLEAIVALIACSTPNSGAFNTHTPVFGVRQTATVNTCWKTIYTRSIFRNFSHHAYIRLQTGSDPDHCPVGRQTLFEFPLRK